jgi:hypothetical protein
MWPGPPGVGRQTVSNVLNGRGRVGEATKARVLDAVTTLGYHPHHGARSLRSRRTRQLAYIMPPMQLLPGNYIMQQFLQALAAASVRRSHNVVLVVRGLPRPEHGTAAPGPQRHRGSAAAMRTAARGTAARAAVRTAARARGPSQHGRAAQLAVQAGRRPSGPSQHGRAAQLAVQAGRRPSRTADLTETNC